MYTAYLNVEELAPVDGTRSCCTRLEDSVAPPLVDFVAPSPWPGDSVTPSSGDLDAPAVQRSLTSLDSRGNTMNTSTSWVLQAVELEDTAKT